MVTKSRPLPCVPSPAPCRKQRRAESSATMGGEGQGACRGSMKPAHAANGQARRGKEPALQGSRDHPEGKAGGPLNKRPPTGNVPA
jgi:hypothetical protein